MKKITAVLLLTAFTFAAAPLSAGSTSAQMNVSVQVIARTILTVESQPASVEVSTADVSRGYVEVPQAVAFRVRSNAANGYSMQFEPVAYPFAQAQVNLGNAVATVGSDGTWLTRPYQQGTTTATMNVRLTLAPGTQPGSYAWPISFAANSL
jgi:hypothetical protein